MVRISPDEFAERVGREVTRTLLKLESLDEDRMPPEELGRRIVARYVDELEGLTGSSANPVRPNRRGDSEACS